MSKKFNLIRVIFQRTSYDDPEAAQSEMLEDASNDSFSQSEIYLFYELCGHSGGCDQLLFGRLKNLIDIKGWITDYARLVLKDQQNRNRSIEHRFN